MQMPLHTTYALNQNESGPKKQQTEGEILAMRSAEAPVRANRVFENRHVGRHKNDRTVNDPFIQGVNVARLNKKRADFL